MTEEREAPQDTAHKERVDLLRVALGEIPSDLVITGGTIIDVNVGNLRKADIAIKGSRIALVGEVGHTLDATTEQIDASGKVIAPGLIDAHMHVESAMVTAHALAEAVLPRGNTTLIAEPHDLADCFGLQGVELLHHEAAAVRLRLFIIAPNPVPLSGPELGSTRGTIGPAEVKAMMEWSGVLGLGKISPRGVLTKDQPQLDKIAIALSSGKPLGGRSDYLRGKEIQAMIDVGIADDYSAHTVEHMREWLQAGLKVIVSEGSTVPRAHLLAQLIQEEDVDPRHCLLCTYDRFAEDVRDKGMIDQAIRVLVREGIDPVVAVQMATLNTAEHFGLSLDLGSIAPGRLADLVILDNLDAFEVKSVYVAGRLAAQQGRVIDSPSPYAHPEWTRDTVKLPPDFGPSTLKYRAPFEEGTVTVRAIGLLPNVSAHDRTGEVLVELRVREGEILPDPQRDVLKLVAIDRFGLSGSVGRGFIQGLGFRQGAIAGTIAHDYHCILASGVSDEEIALSATRLEEMGGGFVIVSGDQTLAKLQLEIGGLITRRSLNEVADESLELEAAARQLGYSLQLPERLHYSLSFLSLPVGRALRLSDKGYIGMVGAGEESKLVIVPLIVEV